MSVVADRCPNCGAPLTIEAGRCTFCHQPVRIGPAGIGSPDAPFAMTIDAVSLGHDSKGGFTIVSGRVGAGRLKKGAALVIDASDGPRSVTCADVVIDGEYHLFADPGTAVDVHLREVYPKDISAGASLRGSGDG